MAVFPERIILKNATDSSSYITSAIAPGGLAACVPGEIVIQRLNGSVRLFTLDSTSTPRQVTTGLVNENKGSLTVSNYGDGSSSFILNAGSVNTNELAANSVTDAKILGPISIAKGGTGQTTANAALNALLPSQSGNSGKSLLTNGTNTSWGIVSYSINDLNDVETITEAAPTISNNQCLKWDSSVTQWKVREDISTDPPIRPDSPCRTGQIAFDEEYLYCCIATNIWNRAPLSYWNSAEIYPKAITSSVNTYKPEEIGRPPDPYISSVSLLIRADGVDDGTVFSDASPNNLTVSRRGTGPVTKTAIKKFGTASAYFDGSYSNGLTVAANSLFSFGAGDFTIETWMYVFNTSVGAAIIGQYGFTFNQSYDWWFYMTDGGTFLQGPIMNLGTGITSFNSYSGGLTNIPKNAWNHVAVSRNGANMRMFVNGIQAGATHNVGTLSLYPSGGPLGLGELGGGAYGFGGYMDEIRITKGVGRYTSNFAVQTEPFNSFVI